MVEGNTPKVKPPESILRKPVVPGPNSWALSQQKNQQQHNISGQSNGTRVIKRDKYENKPMPPPPPDSPSPDARLQPKVYIQPAVPLLNPAPVTKTPHKRAVTDPVVPKPLFGSRKISVTELRRKYSNSKPKAIATENEQELSRQSIPKPPPPSGEARPPAQVSDLQSAECIVRDTTPVPVPATNKTDPFRNTSETSVHEESEPTRLAQLTPVPTRRYLRENGLSTPKIVETFDVAQRQAHEPIQDESMQQVNSTEHTRVAATLYPSRIGTYANTREVNRVEAHRLHRVESCVGVIENADSGSSNANKSYTNSSGAPSQPSSAQDSDGGGLLPPGAYTQSNYGGVWENDPAVGYSLPPFSPMPRGNLSTSNLGGTASQGSGPDVFRGPNASFNRFSQYQESFPSANSWASDSQAHSLGSNNTPLSALLPPRWSYHQSLNAVPSPPANQHDFERAGSVSAALTQIDLTVHHHLDAAFGSLSRLINDKHDRMMDQTLRRLDNLEDMVSKGFRAVKGEIKDVRKDIGKLQDGFSDISKNSDQTTELVKRLEAKMGTLQSLVEEHTSKVERNIAEQSIELESYRQQRIISHRRTESADCALGQGEQRQQYHSCASGSSSSAQQSRTGSRRNRSNTIGSHSAGRMSDERSNRKEFFAEIGAVRGAVPDLKDHPAFAGAQQGQSQNLRHSQTGLPNILSNLPYENHSLSDGRWYQQAYGQGH